VKIINFLEESAKFNSRVYYCKLNIY